jgi:DNA polymerase epsilon subunit 1
LKHHVHNLTKKAILQLSAEFAKLGATVIFANRSKIILKTTKVSVENSYAYAQYIIKAVRSRPLFNYLDLRIEKYWDLLIWMDQYNYGGRACLEISDQDEQELVGLSKWQIKDYLPRLYQPEFEDWVFIFIDSLIKAKTDASTGLSQGTPRITQINHILKNQANESRIPDEDVDHGISEIFRKPILKRLKNLLRNQTEAILNPNMKADYEFPRPPGYHKEMVSPLLELIKSITGVYTLSKSRSLEMALLRKEMLEVIDAKEFEDSSIFENPSTSLIVPSVLCSYCHQLRDIDFCRDEEKALWNCTNCEKPYIKAELEEELIESLRKTAVNYYNQDLKCAKCHKVKDDEMSSYCSCSGSWVETYPKKEIITNIGIYDNIADHYDFRLLKDLIDDVF